MLRFRLSERDLRKPLSTLSHREEFVRGCHFLKAVGEEIRGRGLGVRRVGGVVGVARCIQSQEDERVASW